MATNAIIYCGLPPIVPMLALLSFATDTRGLRPPYMALVGS